MDRPLVFAAQMGRYIFSGLIPVGFYIFSGLIWKLFYIFSDLEAFPITFFHLSVSAFPFAPSPFFWCPKSSTTHPQGWVVVSL